MYFRLANRRTRAAPAKRGNILERRTEKVLQRLSGNECVAITPRGRDSSERRHNPKTTNAAFYQTLDRGWLILTEKTLIRQNLMTREGYSPYCGNALCSAGMPRTKFKNGQFRCSCGWASQFEDSFIQRYLKQWNIGIQATAQKEG